MEVDLISMRIKKFYKKTGRKLQFDAKEPVGFDKTKVECYNCHKTGHFARECRTKEDNRRRDGWNSGNKDGKRTEKREESRALVIVDGESVDWITHSQDDENFAFMASNSSGSNTQRRSKALLLKSLRKWIAQLIVLHKVNFCGILSYENEVYQSVFKGNKSDFENLPLHKKLGKTSEMQAVPPPMTGNYLPSGPDIEIDDSQYTYGPRKSQLSESESQATELDTCDSNTSTELFELVSEPVVNESYIEVQPKVWSDAPFIEEYDQIEMMRMFYPVKVKEVSNVGGNGTLLVSSSSRHMAGNKAYLADFQDFNGGPVAFGGNQVDEYDLEEMDLKWHRRLGHVNFKNLNRLVKGNLVRGLPTKLFQNDHTCVACQKGKQHKASCKAKLVSSISHPLQLLHMDLFGPTSVRSINHKTYCLVITDDFSRFSWTFFLRTKDETSAILKDFIRQIENQLNQKVKTIRCDNGTEFKNKDMIEFCGLKGIKREYSNARTPQQNGVAERKNRTLIEAARTMLADSFLPNTFWAEAVSTACYVLNRVLVTKPHNKTPYELLTGKIPIISYIRPFGCHVTILNTIDHLGKFAGKSDEGFLVGYSLQSKAFRVYNLVTKRVEENLHITFLENKPNVAGKGPNWLFDLDYLTDSMNYDSVRSENQANLHAGQQESNQSTGTKDKIDAGDSEKEDESPQDCFELPIWHSYSSTNPFVSKSDNKIGGPREEEQVFLDDLARLQRQEKEANEEAKALRKNLEQETENLVTQAGAAKSSGTNIFSTVSTTAKASGTNFVNTVSIPVSTASANEGLSLSDTTNTQEDDSEIPPLEDIHQDTTEGIFTHSSYDDEGAEADFTNLETVVNVSPIPTSRMNPSHPSALILGDPTSAVQTRSKVNKSSEAHAFVSYVQKQRRNNHKDFHLCLFACFLSQHEPKKISEALEDESWVDAMQEELLQFEIQKVWILVDLPYGKKAIGTKWVYRNKKDERGVVVRNKARLVAQGHRQEEGNGTMNECLPLGQIDEACKVSQPPGFLDPKSPEKVYKVVKALYGLHQELPKSRSMICSLMYVTASGQTYVCNLAVLDRIILEQISTGNPQQQVVISWQETLTCNAKSIPLRPLLRQNRICCCLATAPLHTDAYEKNFIQSWLLFKSKKIAQVVRAWIQSKNSLVKHFEDMRLCSEVYLCFNVVWIYKSIFDLRRFRESLRRVTDGAEAFLILTLFILCLDKVTKTYKNPSQSHTYSSNLSNSYSSLQALISLTDDLSLLSNMAALESCPKHNMIAYLEKTEGNVEFHEVIDFLQRSYISHALTVSPVVSTTFVEQFWTSAKSKTINNVRHITAKVAGKVVSISEASIRTDLIFDDADGIDSLTNQAIFNAIQLMGYEGDLTVLTFNKALFSPQWRFLFHTINHCLSSKSTSWDQIPTNIATAVICLSTNQKYNFSKLIFDGMLRHLEAKKKFVMYPRFVSIFLGRQLASISVPLDHFPINSLTSKVFSFMIKKGKHFSGKVTPLFDTMLVQPTQDEGASSERLSDAQPSPSPAPTSEVPIESLPDSTSAQLSEVPFEQQPDPSPRLSPRPSPQPSPTPTIPDSIPEPSGENHEDHSSNDASLSGNEDDMTLQNVYDLCISLCQQVSDQAKEIKLLKAKIKKLKKKAKPVIKHYQEYLKITSLQKRIRKKSSSKKQRMHKKNISTEDEVSTDLEKVSTDKPIVSTDGSKISTDEQMEGTEAQSKEENASQASQTSTLTPSSVIFVEDVEEMKRPRPTSTRITSHFKTSSKVDPKDKGKKKIEEEDESESEDDDIPQAVKKFKQLEISNGQKRSFSTLMRVLSVFDREDLNAVYQLVMDKYQDEMPEGFERVLWGDLMVLFKPDEQDEFWNSQHKWNVISWKLHSSSGGISQLASWSKSWLVRDQTVRGNDLINMLIADSLLNKLYGLSMHHVMTNEALASPILTDEEFLSQRNDYWLRNIKDPLMAGSLPQNYKANLSWDCRYKTDC
ncbi:putative ribonuclease H-like domain-containing protein [Tanacetum coccineum]